MLRILAVYNVKGGVGKTTTAVNIAALAAGDGFRTLLWDLDPQGGAGFCLALPDGAGARSRRLLKGKAEPAEVIRPTAIPRLDLWPSDRSYRNMDLHLGAAKKPERRLLKLMRPLRENYDLLVIDCAPSISLVSENVFRAADALLMPVVPNPLSLRAVGQVRAFLDAHRLRDVALVPFLSMVDQRRTLHRQLVESPPPDLGSFSPAWIPYATDVERMTLRRAPLVSFAPGSRAGQAYRLLWEDVQHRLGWGRP